MENIVLKLHYKVHFVQILVEDTDRTLLIDVYNEMFDEVEAENIEWPLNPSLTYSYNSRSVLVREDCDLMEMFNRLGSKKTIDIWVGADDEPCHVLVMARQVRSYNAKKNVEVVEVSEEQNKQGKRREKIPFRTSMSKPPPTSALIPVVEAPDLETIEDVEPLCIEPSNTALISPRRSSRLNKSQVTEPSQPTSPVRLNKNQLSQSSVPSETDMNVGASSADVEPNQPNPHLSSSIRRTSPRFRPSTHVQAANSKISKFKLPRTTALKRGLYVPNDKEPSDYVSEWFSVKRYKEAYAQNIHPIPDTTHWQRFNVPTLEPPQLKRSIGRPARNRRREPGEQRKGKRSIVITCRKCGCTGHNSATCKGGYTAKEKGQLQGKVILKRTKTKSQPTSSRINTTSLHDLEAMIMGSQTSASIIPTPNSQGQSSTQTQPSTSEGPQKRGRKRKSSSKTK